MAPLLKLVFVEAAGFDDRFELVGRVLEAADVRQRVTIDDEDVGPGAGGDDAGFAGEADGKLIGQCALFDFDQVARTCELGITIGDQAYWGRGYGREAVGLLLHYAFRYRNQHKVYLHVH
ncbi:MAG: GNAT family N-acetyltransferase, partial [Anaerolineales bacterium]|nr:GNAT family N-acetyltransferase [Anaerolineales bacterium]